MHFAWEKQHEVEECCEVHWMTLGSSHYFLPWFTLYKKCYFQMYYMVEFFLADWPSMGDQKRNLSLYRNHIATDNLVLGTISLGEVPLCIWSCCDNEKQCHFPFALDYSRAKCSFFCFSFCSHIRLLIWRKYISEGYILHNSFPVHLGLKGVNTLRVVCYTL